MKKVLSILLVLALVMALGVTAFAIDDDEPGGGSGQGGEPALRGATSNSEWSSTPATFNAFIKEYTITGNTGSVLPNETLLFTSVPAQDNPDATKNLTIAPYHPSAASGHLQISVPSFTVPGLYHFTITENAGSTQGVTYANTELKVSVLVTYDYTEECLVADVGITAVGTGSDKTKTDTITNEYDLGTLNISKTVTGNLGDQEQYFDITVTFTTENGKTVNSPITISGGSAGAENATTIAGGWTGTKVQSLKIKHGDTITLSDIPAGVTYAVAEDAKHAAPDLNGADGSKGYTVTLGNENGSVTKSSNSTATITNDKGITIDTGVAFERIPYIVILFAIMSGAALMIRRRRANNA